MNEKLKKVFALCGRELTEEMEQDFYASISEITRKKQWGGWFGNFKNFQIEKILSFDFPEVVISEELGDILKFKISDEEWYFIEKNISFMSEKDKSLLCDEFYSLNTDIYERKNIYDLQNDELRGNDFKHFCKLKINANLHKFLINESRQLPLDWEWYSFMEFIKIIYNIKGHEIEVSKKERDKYCIISNKEKNEFLYPFPIVDYPSTNGNDSLFTKGFKGNFKFGKNEYSFTFINPDWTYFCRNGDSPWQQNRHLFNEIDKGYAKTQKEAGDLFLKKYCFNNGFIHNNLFSNAQHLYTEEFIKRYIAAREEVKINYEEYESIGNIYSAYLYFLSKHNKELHIKILKVIFDKIALFRQPPPILNEKDMQLHVYICASSGSGKSELIKKLVHSCSLSMKRKRQSAIVIDPHGELVSDILDFKSTLSLGNRVFYIDAALFGEKVFCINPFDIRSNTPDSKIQSIAEQLTNTFCALLGDKQSLSLNMRAFLLPCLQVLLRLEDATFKDLQNFMSDEKNAHLVNLGRSLPFNTHAEFFSGSDGFFSKHYEPTKRALHTKMQVLLNSEMFVRMTCGRSSVDFEHEIDQGALFLFNLSKGRMGEASSEAVGRFIISLLSAIALGREDQPKHLRVPTYLFVDEVQNFISHDIEKILTEARKYKMFLTSANQVIGQDMDTQLKDVLLSSGVIFGGMNNASSINAVARNINADPENFKNLRIGEFMMYRKATQNTQVVQIGMVKDKGDFNEAQKFATSAYTSSQATRKASTATNVASTRKIASQEALNKSQGPKFSR